LNTWLPEKLIGVGAIPVALIGALRGVDLILFMNEMKGTSSLIVRQEIDSLKDLDGKRVGTPGMGTIHDAFLSMVEKEAGIKVEHVYGKISDLFLYLQKGEIDGVEAWEPIAAKAVRTLGAKYLIPVVDAGESAGAYWVTREFFDKHPDKVVAFIRAFLRGIQYYRQNKEWFYGYVAPICGFETIDVRNAIEKAPKQQVVDDPNFKYSSIKNFTYLFRDLGKISRADLPDDQAYYELVAQHVNTILLEVAKAEVGFTE